MVNKRILVIGGTGYIGKSIVAELETEFDVTSLSTSTSNSAKHINMNITKTKELSSVVKKNDFVLDLASIKRSYSNKKFKSNVSNVKSILKALDGTSAKLIYFSTQNIGLKDKGAYARSKEKAEELIKKSGIKYAILRLNYVYGEDLTNRVSKLMSLIKKFHIVPVIGSGKTKFEPLTKEDVARYVKKLLKKRFINQTIELSGKDTISIIQLIKIIKIITKNKCLVIHIPLFAVVLLNKLLNFDPGVFKEDIVAKNPVRIGDSLKINIEKLHTRFFS